MSEHVITKEQVKKIAKLVKLNLTDHEQEIYSERFTDTLEYINVLEELDTSSIPETYQVNGLTDVYQTKENKATLSKEDALSNALNPKKGLFATEGVFDRE